MFWLGGQNKFKVLFHLATVPPACCSHSKELFLSYAALGSGCKRGGSRSRFNLYRYYLPLQSGRQLPWIGPRAEVSLGGSSYCCRQLGSRKLQVSEMPGARALMGRQTGEEKDGMKYRYMNRETY
jgi:hypothetical protein